MRYSGVKVATHTHRTHCLLDYLAELLHGVKPSDLTSERLSRVTPHCLDTCH